MDRCPNCDAQVRVNAKFCTSCGFRLPNQAPAPIVQPFVQPQPAERPEGWRSPFSTTSHYETNQSWTAQVPPPPTPEPIAPPASIESIAPTADPTPVFAGWPNFSTSSIPADETAETVAEPAIDAPIVEASASVQDAPPLDDAPVAEVNESDVSEDPTPAQPQSLESDSAAPEDAPATEESVSAESVVEAKPVAPESLPEVEENPADNPTEPIPPFAALAKSDIVQRALGLVDELRSLIPNLRSNVNAPLNAGDAAGILSESGAEQPESAALSDLRAAIQTAASRPRDIDVMLDLVSRAGAIQDLLAERDRYSAAITKAKAALDGDA